jgi:two-component system chemotaxis response regulator CheB
MPRILVVDDSSVARRMLVDILSADPDLEVIGEAGNGAEAVRQAIELSPDVITMDVHMPIMDGLEATRDIMSEVPRPIVIVSSSASRENLPLVFRSLEAGALTVLQKPHLPGHPDFRDQVAALVSTVKLMADVRVVRRRRQVSKETRQERRTAPMKGLAPPGQPAVEVVAIGASTGGPAALAKIFGQLPRTVPVPILVVQHITRGFDQGLVDWLNGTTPLPVHLATDGLPLRPGHVFVAPSDYHLAVSQDDRTLLSDADPVGAHRPSATYLFRSVARVYGKRALGVILTGMGNDGAAGLAALKHAGGRVFAQDEASSVIPSMPREAITLGVVDQVFPLDELPDALLRACGEDRSGDEEEAASL